MKFYLSSYRIGNKPEKLQEFFSPNRNVGFISNALDSWLDAPARKQKHINDDIASLTELGLTVELIDLRDYFGKQSLLEKKLKELGGLWISGGNVFVLRQAMKLSGLDQILINCKDDGFVYGGYSAAGCVLSAHLEPYKIADDPNDRPYPGLQETIWEGLDLIDFVFLPHFDSDHPESQDIQKEVLYCTERNLPFKTLRDGDVLIID